MSGSCLGKIFCVNTFGESHGSHIGAVIDGCPAGLDLTQQDIQKDLDRRRPGSTIYGTSRKESDTVKIISGLFEGKTTGTPIALLIENTDARSGDYKKIAELYRPGHADLTYDQKFGFRDYRGGGRSSGRETAARVAAGAVAKVFLQTLDITINAYVISVGSIHIDRAKFSLTEANQNPLCMPDKNAFERASLEVETAMREGDSLGGIIECVISGAKPGIGEPVFDKLQAVLGHAIFSIGAVKAVEFGAGFKAAEKTAHENNDAFFYENEISSDNNISRVKKKSNNAGGSYGGITDGSEIIFRAAFKPTPSISKTQDTITSDGKNTTIQIKGRHDPVIVPRAVVVAEAMAAIAFSDLLLQNLTSRIDTIKKLYQPGV